MASLWGSPLGLMAVTSADMKVPAILSALDELDARVKGRDHQTDPHTLAASSRLIGDLLALFGVTKKAFGPLLGGDGR